MNFDVHLYFEFWIINWHKGVKICSPRTPFLFLKKLTAVKVLANWVIFNIGSCWIKCLFVIDSSVIKLLSSLKLWFGWAYIKSIKNWLKNLAKSEDTPNFEWLWQIGQYHQVIQIHCFCTIWNPGPYSTIFVKEMSSNQQTPPYIITVETQKVPEINPSQLSSKYVPVSTLDSCKPWLPSLPISVLSSQPNYDIFNSDFKWWQNEKSEFNVTFSIEPSINCPLK